MIRISLPAALAAALLAGCAGPGATSMAPTAIAAVQSDQVSSSPSPLPSALASGALASPMPEMPAGFPIHPEMERRSPEPADIASWITEAAPSDIYDFYLAQLPAAGYVIDLEGPGGEVAIIRFHAPDGTDYQLDLKGYVGQPVEVDLGPPHP